MSADIKITIDEPEISSPDLLSRIDQLQNLFFEDYHKPLNKNSSDSLLGFMTHYTKLKMPLIGAEENGTIVATWKQNDECFSIRFIDQKTIDFAIVFKTNDCLKRDFGRENPYLLFDRYSPNYIFNLL